jgi:hypothetical protein
MKITVCWDVLHVACFLFSFYPGKGGSLCFRNIRGFSPDFTILHPEDSTVRGMGDLNTGVFGMWDKINFNETIK